MFKHLAVIESARPKIIQYQSRDGQLICQSILGGEFESPQHGVWFHHYPLSGGVGVIKYGTFAISRDATEGDVAMALANTLMKYAAGQPFERARKEK